MNEKINELKSSLITGFIDKSTTSLERLRPEILLNDTSTNTKVLTTILNQLNGMFLIFRNATMLLKKLFQSTEHYQY